MYGVIAVIDPTTHNVTKYTIEGQNSDEVEIYRVIPTTPTAVNRLFKATSVLKRLIATDEPSLSRLRRRYQNAQEAPFPPV